MMHTESGEDVLEEALIDLRQVGQRIGSLRSELGISQKELARETALSRQYLTCLENGKKGLSVQTAVKLSVKLHTTTDFLLMGKQTGGLPDEIPVSLAEVLYEPHSRGCQRVLRIWANLQGHPDHASAEADLHESLSGRETIRAHFS